MSYIIEYKAKGPGIGTKREKINKRNTFLDNLGKDNKTDTVNKEINGTPEDSKYVKSKKKHKKKKYAYKSSGKDVLDKNDPFLKECEISEENIKYLNNQIKSKTKKVNEAMVGSEDPKFFVDVTYDLDRGLILKNRILDFYYNIVNIVAKFPIYLRKQIGDTLVSICFDNLVNINTYITTRGNGKSHLYKIDCNNMTIKDLITIAVAKEEIKVLNLERQRRLELSLREIGRLNGGLIRWSKNRKSNNNKIHFIPEDNSYSVVSIDKEYISVFEMMTNIDPCAYSFDSKREGKKKIKKTVDALIRKTYDKVSEEEYIKNNPELYPITTEKGISVINTTPTDNSELYQPIRFTNLYSPIHFMDDPNYQYNTTKSKKLYNPIEFF